MIPTDKLKKVISSIKRPDDVPKGWFCSGDLILSGYTRHAASALLHDLATRPKTQKPRVDFMGKLGGEKINGDKKMVPYYKLVE